jgi:hypothetical protein
MDSASSHREEAGPVRWEFDSDKTYYKANLEFVQTFDAQVAASELESAVGVLGTATCSRESKRSAGGSRQILRGGLRRTSSWCPLFITRSRRPNEVSTSHIPVHR